MYIGTPHFSFKYFSYIPTYHVPCYFIQKVAIFKRKKNNTKEKVHIKLVCNVYNTKSGVIYDV